MFSLTMDFDDKFEFKGMIINVDMMFDNILMLYEMFNDEEILEYEKIFIALQMLIYEYDELELDSYEEAYELFKYIMLEFLEIDLDKNEQDTDDSVRVKTYDYKKDAELIFSSFYSVYNIDLFSLKGKLHWKKFNALLVNLDDNSPFKQVIGYRTMEVPSEKEASKNYIRHVREMKQKYSLDDKPKDINKVFDTLASILRSK